MTENERTTTIRHEDEDDLVVALGAVCAADAIKRHPGFIHAAVEVPTRSLTVAVFRSRFDADYGSICRLRVYSKGVATGRLAFAPTFEVVDVLNSGDGWRERLLDLYNEWDKKGNAIT